MTLPTDGNWNSVISRSGGFLALNAGPALRGWARSEPRWPNSRSAQLCKENRAARYDVLFQKKNLSSGCVRSAVVQPTQFLYASFAHPRYISNFKPRIQNQEATKEACPYYEHLRQLSTGLPRTKIFLHCTVREDSGSHHSKTGD